MIRASTTTPPSIVINGQPHASGGGLWSYFDMFRVFTAQIPQALLSTSARELTCTPQSYSQDMDYLHRFETDRRVRAAYVRKAVETLPLNVLLTSVYIWGHDNFELICKCLATDERKFRQLIELAPPEKYTYFPGHCTTKLQIQILTDDAFKNESKLKQLTEIILTMIGDPRNGDELDSLYYYYLKLLILRKESDAYVAERIQSCKTALAMEQVEALKKIENAPLIAKALETIL